MKLNLNGYKIETDDYCFIVTRFEKIKASHLTKQENVGKLKEGKKTYHSSLESALKSIGMDILLQTDPIEECCRLIKNMNDEIKSLVSKLEIVQKGSVK